MRFIDYLNIINNSHVRNPIYRIQFLRNEDNSIIDEYSADVVDGNGEININLNQGTRRSVSFTLINVANKYSYLFNNLKLGSLFSISLGFKNTLGETYYISQGVFVFTDPNLIGGLSDNHIEINGVDKWGLLDGTAGGILESTYSISRNTTVNEIINSLFALDIINTNFTVNIDNSIGVQEIPYDIEKEAGENISDILLEVASATNSQIYFDEFGTLIMKPFDYDFIKQSSHDFIYGTDINYIEASKNILYSNLYNGVFIIGDNMQDSSVPIRGYLVNNDPSDPNSAINLGYIRWKQITEYTEGIVSQDIADERCRYELKQAINKQSNIDINCVPMYHLDVNDLITLTDSRIGDVNEKYIIQSINVGIGVNSQMSINASRAKEWL